MRLAETHHKHHKGGELSSLEAQKDAIHPTPVFELLGLALEEFVDRGGMDVMELCRLEAPMEIAVKNMVYRGLDQDGNAGVVFERMAQVLLRCSMAQGDPERQKDGRCVTYFYHISPQDDFLYACFKAFCELQRALKGRMA